MAILKKNKTKEEKPEIKTNPEETKTINDWSVLISPYVSEKSSMLENEGKYVFKVSEKSNKQQIKKAIKDLYKVEIVSVNIVNIPRKKKRVGRYDGHKKGFKKAIVKVKKGQKIDVTSK